MIYKFADIELDDSRAELRVGGEVQAVEPQVFGLLELLLENAGRVVTKEELTAKVWNGRFVSDAAIASRIKSARRVIGDDGASQRLIKTVRARGFRFVGTLEIPRVGGGQIVQQAILTPASQGSATADTNSTRPSIAVLPFQLIGDAGSHGTIAEALPHDLIAELARLRWLFVIARASTFRFASADADVRAVGEVLGVRYCLTGSVQVLEHRMGITVELADTRDGGVVWADRYAAEIGSVHEIRAQVIDSIVSTLEVQITANEARLARVSSPESLDAWSYYHLGIAHMHRFTKEDNAAAMSFFSRAVALEPGFCRAHAGLSFTYSQNAFVHYSSEPEAETVSARRHAERSLELDELDPFANLTLGRSFWLEGDLEQALSWLGRATHLCPSYAKSIYAEALAETMRGRGAVGEAFVETALALSPLDPLRYAMLGTRALSHVVRENFDAAAAWAEKAARSPGATVVIDVIAAAAHELNGDEANAARRIASVRRRHPDLGQDDFFRYLPFEDEVVRASISRALKSLGM